MTTTHDERNAVEHSHDYPMFAGITRLNSPRELLEAAQTQSSDYVVSRSAAEALRALLRAAKGARSDVSAAISDGYALTIISDASATSAQLAEVHEAVLAPVEVQRKRLAAARFQRELMGPEAVLVTRTLAAVSSNLLLGAPAEDCDQPFVLGATELGLPAFADCQRAYLTRRGLHDGPVCEKASAWIDAHADASLVERWQRAASLRTFGEAVAELMKWPIEDSHELPMPPAAWREFSRSRPLPELREHADVLGLSPTWDHDHARTVDGYYRVRGGIDYAIARSLATAPYADLLWLVAATPDLVDAHRYAQAMRNQYPDKLLAFQLTSSGEAALAAQGSGAWQRFGEELQQLGYVLHATTHDSAGARQLRDPVRLVP